MQFTANYSQLFKKYLYCDLLYIDSIILVTSLNLEFR